jgi:tRNA 5-methylaminomethyl-2-thiouridine biosynthesis bifunctional protein
MPEPIIPARLAFASGVPWSDTYGDIYHSADGGPGQAAHVFLGGNALPERWRGRDRHTVLETGFGTGLNFLTTWQAWRDDAGRCGTLHYVSIEKHPLRAEDLARALAAHTALAPLARALLAQWPLPLAGMHRMHFEDERVVLTLAFADIAEALPQLRLAADTLFLDGFSPAHNPEMWSAQTLRALTRLAAPGAAAATWSAASAVREGLGAAGWTVEKRPGFGSKRDMSVARLRPGVSRLRLPGVPPERRAIVIGAGLAGASVCERLCARGWAVTLIERHAGPAAEASGNLAGIFHPVVTRDDSHLARLSRAGYLAALTRWQALDARGLAPQREHCGVLQLARDDEEARAQQEAMARLALPAGYARALSAEEAGVLAGCPVAAPGLWFEQGGWIRPPSLVRALLAACGERLTARYGAEADTIARDPVSGEWRVHDAAGTQIASAPLLVLANASGLDRLAPRPDIRLNRVRGQVSHLPAGSAGALRTVVLRGGFVLPAIAGRTVVGASFDLDDDEPGLRPEAHQGNLARLAAILPGLAGLERLDPATLEGRVGFRAVAPDRLPLVGPMPAEDARSNAGTTLAGVARSTGLHAVTGFASRGLVWSAFCAELLADRIEGTPLPVEATLADALDPARFALRAGRRRA